MNNKLKEQIKFVLSRPRGLCQSYNNPPIACPSPSLQPLGNSSQSCFAAAADWNFNLSDCRSQFMPCDAQIIQVMNVSVAVQCSAVQCRAVQCW